MRNTAVLLVGKLEGGDVQKSDWNRVGRPDTLPLTVLWYQYQILLVKKNLTLPIVTLNSGSIMANRPLLTNSDSQRKGSIYSVYK